MTLDEFELIIKRKTDSGKYFNYFICFSFLLFGLYMLIGGIKNAYSPVGKLFFVLLTLYIIMLSIYAIWVIKNRYKVKIWYNSLTKEQNIELLEWLLSVLNKVKPVTSSTKDHLYFIYKKNWWGLSYSIHLFADKNHIAIHVDSTSYHNKGIVDFGASRYLQNKILARMEERSLIYLNNS